MSARVFNPVLVSEIKHAHTPRSDINIAGLSAKNISVLSPIRRNLFGSVDREECRILVERELEKHAALNKDHWEFDFMNEIPCPKKGRFVWEPIPERLNSTRPIKRERDSSDDISHLYHIPLNDDTPSTVVDKEIKRTIVHINKKQAKITGKLSLIVKIYI